MNKFNSLNVKILLFILFIFTIGMSIYGFIEYQYRTKQLMKGLEEKLHQSYDTLPFLIQKDAEALGKNLAGIVRIEQFLSFLAQKDREKLFDAAKDLFSEIKSKYRLTHLYFIEPSGAVLLRVHKPQQYGDVLKRVTFLGAQRNNALFTGLEMGKNFFSLRAVQPVSYQGKAIGYIEVGQEIDHLFNSFHTLTHNDAAVLLTQQFIQRKKANVKGAQIGQFTLLQATNADLLSQLHDQRLISLMQQGLHTFSSTLFDIDDKQLLVSVGPFRDASNEVVGVLLIKQDISKAYHTMRNNLYSNFIILGVILLALVSFLLILLHYLVLKPVKLIQENSQHLANGEVQLDSMDVLTRRTDELGKMGLAFQNMAQTLAKASWLKTGQSELVDRFSGEHDVLSLAEKTLNYLTPYVEAQVGLFYAVTQQDKQPILLKLLASYAYMHRKGMENTFALGEGLIGQVALERKTIIISDVPEGYIRLQSGSGYATPYNVLAIPCLHEQELKAVLELGSFKPFTPMQIELLEQVMPALGIAINTAESRNRMKVLLEQSEMQTAELRKQKVQMEQQQAELQESNEKLQTQSEELQAQSEELQSQQEELRQTNEELEQRTRELERQQTEVEQKNTALEKARSAIQVKADELELTSKYKSEFLANMSHELRTPLNSLLILAQMLAENKTGNLDEKQIEQAQTIHSAGADLLNLINDILDLSKVEAGKIQLHIESFPLSKLLNNSQQRFQPLAEQKALTFDFSVAEGVPDHLISDIQRLQQILTNLLSNAFKFTEQGSVKLHVYRADPDELVNLNLKPEQNIAFSVTDTGIGIPIDKLQVIFEAFQQVDGTTSRRFGGTGLGLSISRQLARLLGSDIRLHSVENQGSTFTLYVPEKLASSESPAQAQFFPPKQTMPTTPPTLVQATALQTAVTTPKTPPKTEITVMDDRDTLQPDDKVILIIDDDPKFSAILIDMGHEQGYKCLLAENGRDGLAVAEEYKPNGILLDLGLPLIDGLTVMDQLKQNFTTRHIPVHVLSASEYSYKAKQMGALGYAMKPLDMSQLHDAFAKLRHIVDKEMRFLLLVFDNDERGKKIQHLLSANDVRIEFANTAAKALVALQTRNVDCTVLDMDNSEALALLNILRSEQQQSSVPLIFYAERELTDQEEQYLHAWQGESPLKAVYSLERLVDEATLFLHQVEAELPEDKRNMLRSVHDREAVLKERKVLLVDDDVRNIYSLSHVLQSKGMKVFATEDGKKALALLQQHPDVDVVLMDIMMPELDGYETIRQIRTQPVFRKLPIIALTAKAMKDDRSKCLEAGANDYLSKPINNDQLLSLLRVWLYR